MVATPPEDEDLCPLIIRGVMVSSPWPSQRRRERKQDFEGLYYREVSMGEREKQ